MPIVDGRGRGSIFLIPVIVTVTRYLFRVSAGCNKKAEKMTNGVTVIEGKLSVKPTKKSI